LASGERFPYRFSHGLAHRHVVYYPCLAFRGRASRRKEIGITKEVPSLLQKMQRGKFYTAEELLVMEYGIKFDEMAPDTEAIMWAWWNSLITLLASLVMQEKVVTGIRIGDTGRTFGNARKKVTLSPEVHYGLP